MTRYIVNTNAQANGDHEVHRDDGSCGHMPDLANRKALGDHATCAPAVAKAKQSYPQSNGCYYCSEACHTG
jgi:hypothetical protein